MMRHEEVRPMSIRKPFHLVVTALLLASGIVVLAQSGETVGQGTPKNMTAEERKAYEKKVDWFYKAKYGIMFHFVPNMHRFTKKRKTWTAESWDKWVADVDVEKVADQAKEVGAGYVVLSLAQGGGYACCPNPVIEEYWGEEGKACNSTRDLPMDLFHALEKRGIPMMLYLAVEPPVNPGKKGGSLGWFTDKRKRSWEYYGYTKEGLALRTKEIEWYSKHYGDKAKGWWVDGTKKIKATDRPAVHKAVASGNPDAIVTLQSKHDLSDYEHGHCTSNWEKQKKRVPRGRWSARRIQTHIFQHLGHRWAASTLITSNEEMVDYVTKVVKNGGVVTFDVGTFTEEPKIEGPYLDIPENQMNQLKAIRDALKDSER